MLGYERLDVYQRAIEFLALSATVLESLPRGNAMLADQLKRAALSIPLNIAEGSGKTSGPDAARFYAIARGSAMECGAILDACRVLKLVGDEQFAQGKELLTRVVSMLSKML